VHIGEVRGDADADGRDDDESEAEKPVAHRPGAVAAKRSPNRLILAVIP
jgi:hypothetical protein